MTPAERKTLLTKYINGSCTPEEERKVAWLLRSKDLDLELQQLLDEMMSIDADGSGLSSSDKNRIYQNIQQNISQERKSWWTVRYSVAASIALILVCVVGWYVWKSSDHEPAYHLVASGEGREVITMPDGTTIWLNARSVLKYTDDYGKEDRSVALNGEAFFEVTKNKEKPFFVTAGEITTRVLGTSFNVSEDKNEVAVTLVEGKVAVKKTGEISEELATLTSNQQIIYNKISDESTVNIVVASDYMAWKDDVLLLKNITMKEAISKIEKWYSVKIVVKDSAINKCIINASFRKESLATVLRTIGMTSSFTYEQKGKEVILSGKGCL